MHRDKFLIIKPTRCTNFSKFLFWNETLHVSDSYSVHHQEFFTVHTVMVYVIHVCWQLASRIRMELGILLCHTGLLTACEQDQDGTRYMSYRLAGSLRAGSGWNSVYVIQVCWQLASRIRMEIGICHTDLLTACEQDQDGTRYMSYRFADSLRAGSGWKSVYVIQVCWQLASRMRMKLGIRGLSQK